MIGNCGMTTLMLTLMTDICSVFHFLWFPALDVFAFRLVLGLLCFALMEFFFKKKLTFLDFVLPKKCKFKHKF